jgi:hypothetical protein
MQILFENKKIDKLLQIALIIVAFNISSCRNIPETKTEEFPYTIGEVLISEDFSGNLSQWSIEGERPEIINGRLEFDTHEFSVIWLKPSLIGNVMIEYDVIVPGRDNSGEPEGSFGCFAMAIDPANPNKFFASAKERAGALSGYDKLNMYDFESGCGKSKYEKFLRYSDGNKELISEKKGSKYSIISNKTYHAKIIFFEKNIEFYLNNKYIFHYQDSLPYTKGNFGLTVFANRISIDNLIITHLRRP